MPISQTQPKDIGRANARPVLDCTNEALSQAIIRGDLSKVLLFAPRVDNNVLDGEGMTALMRASHRCSEPMVRALLPYSDADTPGAFGMTALMSAVKSKKTEMVRLLLPCTDAKLKDERGWTALHWSAINGHVESINALLPLSDPNAFDNAGWSPLMCAAILSMARSVDELLPHTNLLALNERDERMIDVLRHKRHPTLCGVAGGGVHPMLMARIEYRFAEQFAAQERAEFDKLISAIRSAGAPQRI